MRSYDLKTLADFEEKEVLRQSLGYELDVDSFHFSFLSNSDKFHSNFDLKHSLSCPASVKESDGDKIETFSQNALYSGILWSHFALNFRKSDSEVFKRVERCEFEVH